MSNHDKIVDNITQVIGNTPLIRLQKITGECQASVVAKVENMNPLWSVKDRIGKAMIDAAERDGKIQADTTIIESEIDQMVYELYGLTDEEIQIVEESVG